MWLINTTTLELHEFIDVEHAPRYAILSHCWGEGEISFKDFRKKRNCHGAGYDKIVNCCVHAREHGYKGQRLEWAWVDTCCIDKRSSAELSEAINSMYVWYQKAYICYAHLADIDIDRMSGANGELSKQRFVYSRWFNRGWTLQELLAPAQVVFVDANWQYLGAKHEEYYPHNAWAIESRTGIPLEALCDNTSLQRRYSVAQRMSWASNRITTRLEDAAYSLLGLFDINMPLLYGEGEKAFLRLQHEILRQQQGESIFATGTFSHSEDNPIFAHSSRDFSRAMHVVEMKSDTGPLFVSVGRGLQLRIPAHPQKLVYRHVKKRDLLVRLRCGRPKDGRMSICIMQLSYHEQGCGHFYRSGVTGITVEAAHHRTDTKQLVDEDDIEDWSRWRPVEAAGSLYVHADDKEISRCATLRELSSNFSGPVHGASQHAVKDALELNIQ